ncbi:hypothetical protein RI367_002529 [Sorochytrium milnesiophthora]
MDEHHHGALLAVAVNTPLPPSPNIAATSPSSSARLLATQGVIPPLSLSPAATTTTTTSPQLKQRAATSSSRQDAAESAQEEEQETLAKGPSTAEAGADFGTVGNAFVTALTTPQTPLPVLIVMNVVFFCVVAALLALSVWTLGIPGNGWAWFLLAVNTLLWGLVNYLGFALLNQPADANNYKDKNE